ncbi:MAG TPA: porphobilinogen synthase [Chloroflexota bacterium]|nr:porphobilinogen synthase [Chloroflexota bacterium]
MSYPRTRLRRLRQSTSIRRMVRETRLTVDSLVYPLFVDARATEPQPIDSMPGQFRWPVDRIVTPVRDAAGLGIPAVVLFGLPGHKDPGGSGAYDRDGIVQQALRRIKDAAPEVVTIADTCLDEYTDHGHCGVIRDGVVDNDATLEILSRIAVSQAAAGADVVAPSDMMDGRVGAIRRTLDESGFDQVPIMSYAAKFASAYYGPFREAADCAPQFGDRRTYQMDPGNAREALREVRLDIEEGADIVMVKPALAYLDVVRQVRDAFDTPVAAYNVSGEYAMVKAASRCGWIDERAVVLETLTAIARAGAGLILTYHALDAARWLQEGAGAESLVATGWDRP